MGKNVAVFVDVANIFYAAKAAGVDIDYVTLLKASVAGRDFVRAYAYTGLDPDNENQRNFHSFLARHGYKVVSKDIRKYGDGKVKANLDIELVVDMMKTARNLDVAVVISGDGDFAPAIRAVQEMGVRVEVISFRGNTSSDLIEVADIFTDITQVARVERGSSRSGRRVAGDEEDLSMTEVPDKETEGARGRGRGRGRGRTTEPEPVAAGGTRGGRRPALVEAARPAAAGVEAGPGVAAGGRIVALPGEKLSRASRVLGEDAVAAAAAAGEPESEAESEAEAAATAAEEGQLGEGEEGAPRRRRRRGGRGRGRGRGRAEADLEQPVDDLVGARAPEEEEFPVAPRGPRPTPFGSVWDSQLGMPPARPAGLSPLPAAEDEGDFDEPEIPEYLLAERRQERNRGGRGRTARSGYAAAVERERFGRGGSAGGVNRYPDVSRVGGQGGGRPPRRDDRQAPRPRQERPVQPQPHAPQSRGSEPWTEVPPELEEMVRAQLAGKLGRPGQPAGQAQSERQDRRERPGERREGAQPSRGGAAGETPVVAGESAQAGLAPSGAPETVAAPARRRRGRVAAESGEPMPAIAEASEAQVAAPAVAEPAATPKRRGGRRAAAKPEIVGEGASVTASEAPSAEAQPEAATPRRRGRRPASDEPTEAAPSAAVEEPAQAGEAATAPRRRAVRRPKAEAAAPSENTQSGAVDEEPSANGTTESEGAAPAAARRRSRRPATV